MPYKVGRVSNNQSKGSGSRKVVVENVAENVVVESVSENIVESVAEIEEMPIVPVVEALLENDVLDVPLQSEVPLPSETPDAPLFNEDFSKVFNPLTNRYVKVGGDKVRKFISA